VVLDELNKTIVQEVVVQELVYGTDSPHVIDIFTGCGSVGTNVTSYSHSGNKDQLF